MNPFKCRHCSKPAHFYFRDGGMLCVDHGALHATAQMKDMLERSRLDKSSCGVAESRSEGRHWPSPSCAQSAKPMGGCTVQTEAGVASGPQDSLSLPRFIPPEAGAPASHPLPVTAGAALSDDLPIFPGRKNATTFRVTADSSIHGSPSSFSMGTAGHGAIVDAHNTIVRGG